MYNVSVDFSLKSSPIRMLQDKCPEARITTTLLRIVHDDGHLPVSPKQLRALSTHVYQHLKPEDSGENEENYDETLERSRLMRCGERLILELPESLGEGQSGEVKLGMTTDGKCAIKARNGSSPQSKRTEKAEIFALKTLSDIPEVVNLLALDDNCIVLEYCDSDFSCLINWIHTGAYNLPKEDLHNFCKQIIMATCKIHEKGIIHSDLKPDNIMLILETDQVKIADFDYSVGSPDKIHGGSFIYYPPEQLANTYFQHFRYWDQETQKEEWNSKETELRLAGEKRDFKKVDQLIKELQLLESKIAPPLSPLVDVWSGGLVMADLSWEYLSEPFRERLKEYKEKMCESAKSSGGNPVIYAALVHSILEKWQSEWVEKGEHGEWSGIFAGLKPTNEIEALLAKALDFDPATRISSDQMRRHILDLEENGRFLASPIAQE